jgi:hypothetical protein
MILLVLMTLNSATLLLARCIGAALLLLVGMSSLFGFLAAEMGLYLLYKVARGDFYHWLQVDGTAGLAISLLLRVMVKVIADFTGVVQSRGPAEMGGLYFTVNSVMGFVFCFVALQVYFADDAGAEGRIKEADAMDAFYKIFGFWALTAALGISIMKREFWGTFVSLETGNDWAQNKLLRGKDDFERSDMFTINRKKWERVSGEAKEWVQDNWFKWKEEEPEWFDDAWIAKVPDDFIPIEEDRKVLKELRRKSSTFGIGGGDGSKMMSFGGGGGGGALIFPGGGEEEMGNESRIEKCEDGEQKIN